MALQITGSRKGRNGVITHVCGSGWTDTVEGVISDINNGRYSYWVNIGGNAANVYVVAATSQHKAYLKTTADTTTRNNLDYLPDC